MVPSDARPPFLLQRQPMPRVALETILFNANPGAPYAQGGQQQALDALLAAPDTLPAQETYLFAQYVIYLYVTALMTMQTAEVIRSLTAQVLVELRMAYNNDVIKDGLWRTLVEQQLNNIGGTVADQAAVDRLGTIGQRLAVETHYPGITELLAVVRALYGTRSVVLAEAQLYRVHLAQLPDYRDPTIILLPTRRIALNTTGFERTADLGWKLLFSSYHQCPITAPGCIDAILVGVAELALPLDPIELTDRLTMAMRFDVKAGIPFRNYLAMYLRQVQFRFDYQLSRLADNRRQLMRRLHAFCGVGATTVADRTDALFFLRSLSDKLDVDADARSTVASADELGNLRYLIQIVCNDDPQQPRLTTKLRYEAAFEAAKTKPPKPAKTPPDDPAADPPAKVPKVPNVPVNDGTPTPPTDDGTSGAFADDPDQLDSATDPTQNPSQGDESDNDNIEPTNPAGSTPVNTVTSIIPLALPGETTDDHLLRLMLLHYVNTAKRDANPDITAETLLELDYWCQNWLFLASIDVTKQLLTKFNLTAKLKELVA